jgi:hypothetical protein
MPVLRTCEESICQLPNEDHEIVIWETDLTETILLRCYHISKSYSKRPRLAESCLSCVLERCMP